MKEIDGLYIFGAYVQPMIAQDGSWFWVVTDFAFEPEIYNSEGKEHDISRFQLHGESADELLKPFQDGERIDKIYIATGNPSLHSTCFEVIKE